MKKSLLFVMFAALLTMVGCDSFDEAQKFTGTYECTYSGTRTISTLAGDDVETFENESLGVNVLISPTATPDEVSIIAVSQGTTMRAKVNGNRLTIIEDGNEIMVLGVPITGISVGGGELVDGKLILDFTTTATATLEIMNIPTNVHYTSDMVWTMTKK